MNNEKCMVGQMVETLINIKDRYGDTLSRGEIEVINDVCNILDHRFNRFDTADVLIDEHITSIHWQTEDIKTALVDYEFSPTEDNINSVMSYPKFERYLQERSIAGGWDVIYNTISELKDTLIPLQEG